MDYIQRFLSTITKNCKRQAEFTQLEKPSSLLKYHSGTEPLFPVIYHITYSPICQGRFANL